MGAGRLVGLLIVGALVVACVDNEENARQFCDRHQELLAESRDGETLTAEQAEEIESEVEKTMADAEDATRGVRGAARDLVAAYDEIGGLVDDEDATAEELQEANDDLLTARRDLREACGEVPPAG